MSLYKGHRRVYQCCFIVLTIVLYVINWLMLFPRFLLQECLAPVYLTIIDILCVCSLVMERAGVSPLPVAKLMSQQ